jgi:hypothetical protein
MQTHEGGGVGESYEIRVKGHLNARWADWFDGLILAQEGAGAMGIALALIDMRSVPNDDRKARKVVPARNHSQVRQLEPHEFAGNFVASDGGTRSGGHYYANRYTTAKER